jgi:2-aminoadipate transaminase
MRTVPAFAARTAGITGSVIDSSTSLLQSQTHDIVRFAMGSPAAEAMPTAVLCEAAATALGDPSGAAFDYGASEGELALRESVLDLVRDQEGSAPAPERLLITAGGMQGLDLACKLFVDRGDLVVVESPTYTNGSATIAGYEGELLEAPIDEDGLIVDALPGLVADAGRPPKLIYVIPNFQNPTGVTLSLERRRRLIELAEAWGAVILEDDPYAALRFEGEGVPSIEALAGDRVTVVGVRTFSKILAPGLRVGWLTAPPDIVAKMVFAKQSIDTCTNVPAQLLVDAFLRAGHLAPHLEALRQEYRARKQAMQAALAREFDDVGVTFTDPQGGFFLWVTFPEPFDGAELFPAALAEGVAYIPGSAFSPSGAFAPAIRLCFASTRPDRIEEGIRRLRRAYDRHVQVRA